MSTFRKAVDLVHVDLELERYLNNFDNILMFPRSCPGFVWIQPPTPNSVYPPVSTPITGVPVNTFPLDVNEAKTRNTCVFEQTIDDFKPVTEDDEYDWEDDKPGGSFEKHEYDPKQPGCEIEISEAYYDQVFSHAVPPHMGSDSEIKWLASSPSSSSSPILSMFHRLIHYPTKQDTTKSETAHHPLLFRVGSSYKRGLDKHCESSGKPNKLQSILSYMH